MKTRVRWFVVAIFVTTGLISHEVGADDFRAMVASYKPYVQTAEDQLRRAAGDGDVQGIKRLVARGAKIDSLDSDGWSPLTLAVAQYQPAAVSALLELGAKTNAVGKTRHTPLGWAVIRGYTDMVETLLANGANVEAKDEKGWTPLMEASARGYADVVELLLSKGANANARDRLGATSMNLSSFYSRNDVSTLLVAKGADPSVKLHRIAIAFGVEVPPTKLREQESIGLAQRQVDGPQMTSESRPEAKIALLTLPAVPSAEIESDGRGLEGIRSQPRRAAPTPFPQTLNAPAVTGTSQTDQRRAGALSLLRQGLTIWNQLNAEYPEIARRVQELSRGNQSLDAVAREMRKGF